MGAKERYEYWLKNAKDKATAAELRTLDESEIRERFTMDLEFGTGGLRGVLGAGSARMNTYTVGRATQGLAEYMCAHGMKSIAISYDSRHMSDTFAQYSAEVMAGNGIKAWLYPVLMPTPALSFAVRELLCGAGIMITASHNPAKYNGYKVYGPDGCQITLEAAEEITHYISRVDEFKDVRYMPRDEAKAKGLFEYIPQRVSDSFMDAVLKQSISGATGLNVVYSPLNGTGNKPVREALRRIGANVTVVSSQEYPDGTFPTCPFPNPEVREAMSESLKLCDTLKPDLALATDPDCDRVGIAARDEAGEYHLMSGNEVGVLLMDCLLSERQKRGTLTKDPIVVKTIVSTPLAYPIARKYGAEVIDVLTGFKFIGEQIALLEDKGQKERFILGFEESYGYLIGTHSRDKDGVVASMMICECAAALKARSQSMYTAMQALYRQYGYVLNSLLNITCEGLDGMARIERIMDYFRTYRGTFDGAGVTCFTDYEKCEIHDLKSGAEKPTGLPSSNVLSFALDNGAQVLCRPSGTEPKIKFYITSTGATREASEAMGTSLNTFLKGVIDSIK